MTFGNSSDGLFHKHFEVCLPVCVRMTMFSGRACLSATSIADLKQHSAARPEKFIVVVILSFVFVVSTAELT